MKEQLLFLLWGFREPFDHHLMVYLALYKFFISFICVPELISPIRTVETFGRVISHHCIVLSFYLVMKHMQGEIVLFYFVELFEIFLLF